MGEGYEARNATVVERGVLRTYLLDQYGARKTGLSRSVTAGGAVVVEPGTTPLDSLIKDIRAGILITRFSGGRPNGPTSAPTLIRWYASAASVSVSRPNDWPLHRNPLLPARPHKTAGQSAPA